MQSYAKKEHEKLKKERALRHKLEAELKALKAGHNLDHDLMASLHDQIDAELHHSSDFMRAHTPSAPPQ